MTVSATEPVTSITQTLIVFLMTTSTMSHQTYKRRVQLDTWKELIHSTHDFKRPVKDHLESIEKLVSKLESNGFTWSKDSVLGMLFQIGLPDQSPTSFAHTNDILDLQSIHQPNHVISADQVKEVILSEEIRMKSPKLSLLDLPLSLFPQILHELAGGSISSKTHLTMTRHPEGPAMNRWWDLDAAHKIRSLASVNRHLRQVCMPFMWKASLFSPFPSPTNHVSLKNLYSCFCPDTFFFLSKYSTIACSPLYFISFHCLF